MHLNAYFYKHRLTLKILNTLDFPFQFLALFTVSLRRIFFLNLITHSNSNKGINKVTFENNSLKIANDPPPRFKTLHLTALKKNLF